MTLERLGENDVTSIRRLMVELERLVACYAGEPVAIECVKYWAVEESC